MGLNEFWNLAQVLAKAKTQYKSKVRWEQFIQEWLDAFRLLKSVHFLTEQFDGVTQECLVQMVEYEALFEEQEQADSSF